MSALAEKLRQARTLHVVAGGFDFYVLRPTPLEREEKLRGNAARGILSLIVGWGKVTELAMLGVGAPHPLPRHHVAPHNRYEACSTSWERRTHHNGSGSAHAS